MHPQERRRTAHLQQQAASLWATHTNVHTNTEATASPDDAATPPRLSDTSSMDQGHASLDGSGATTPAQDAVAVHGAVKAFDHFLQRHGGHDGGWDADDHMQVLL